MVTSDSPVTHETPAWADRAAARSRSVQRSRIRSIEQAQTIVAAARRLLETEGSGFTTQQLSKEAGIALQTFYRHFASKDQLLLAVFEDFLIEASTRLAEAARELPDPLSRLRFYISSALHSLDGTQGAAPRFITAEHWRLYQLFPTEMAGANQSFADLIEQELRNATRENLLHSADPAADAWLATKLVMSVYHHYAFAPSAVDTGEIGERLWSFCLAAFGGQRPDR
ncbi:TetR/AcrR family transcriptional regulator [Nocardia vaccinii]|uniref:TetR/AcrR family transcriptional regulator n=1 Tax=Nocardia vaccinii TaxID=1822 RepID=UPI000831A37C|nr:TetR/AcrR family transcriptional regulator [Nocardia vaccinii]